MKHLNNIKTFLFQSRIKTTENISNMLDCFDYITDTIEINFDYYHGFMLDERLAKCKDYPGNTIMGKNEAAFVLMYHMPINGFLAPYLGPYIENDKVEEILETTLDALSGMEYKYELYFNAFTSSASAGGINRGSNGTSVSTKFKSANSLFDTIKLDKFEGRKISIIIKVISKNNFETKDIKCPYCRGNIDISSRFYI